MSIWQLLGFKHGREADSGPAETDTVHKIAGQLSSLPPDKARFVAAFAYVLARVAYADRDISGDEREVMQLLVEDVGLTEAQATLVVDIASQRAELFGGTENFLVTHEFAEIASREEREHLLDALFAVAAADDSISNIEDGQIREIATELGFTHREFVTMRSVYSDKRAVLKGE